MKKHHYPYVALGLGLMLLLFVLEGSRADAGGNTRIPLLTLLIFNECAFFLTAAGVYIGLTHRKQAEKPVFYLATTAFCGLLSLIFIYLGVVLWPL